MAITTIGGPATGLQQYEERFESSGIWTKPLGVKSVELTLIGGGSGPQLTNTSGAGAGYYKGIIDVSNDSSIPITIGSGALGIGGTSSFGTKLACSGGSSNTVPISSGQWYYPTISGSNTRSMVLSAGIPPQIETGFTLELTEFGYSIYTNIGGSVFRMSDTGTSSIATLGSIGTYGYTFPKLAYGNSTLIAVANSGAVDYKKSTDGGVTFTTVAPSLGTIHSVSFANGVWFMGVGNTGQMKRSTDLVTWTDCTIPAVTNVVAGKVIYGDGIYISLPYSGNNSFNYYWSFDGITFKTAVGNTNFPSSNIDSPMEYFNNHFYFNGEVGSNAKIYGIATSSILPAAAALPFTALSFTTTANWALIHNGIVLFRTSSTTQAFTNSFNGLVNNGFEQYVVTAAAIVRPYTYKDYLITQAAGTDKVVVLAKKGEPKVNIGVSGGGTSYAGPGAGGCAFNATTGATGMAVAGPGIDGYCVGAITGGNRISASNGSGGISNSNPGGPGLAIVRWWA